MLKFFSLSKRNIVRQDRMSGGHFIEITLAVVFK